MAIAYSMRPLNVVAEPQPKRACGPRKMPPLSNCWGSLLHNRQRQVAQGL
jgi:hypothetical protein